MASPHVVGVAALLMAAHPSATVSDIATVLKETARHPGGDHNRPDNRWGYGMIRPQEALSAVSLKDAMKVIESQRGIRRPAGLDSGG